MSILQAVVEQYSNTFGSDEDFRYVRAMRDGSLSFADFLLTSVLEGRGHHITVGAFSTGLVPGGDGTILDADQPIFIVSAPSGISIIPIRVDMQAQTSVPTDAEEIELLLAVDQDAAWDGTGTSTTEVIYNMNTLKGWPTGCSAISATSENITTAPVLDLELARKVIEFDVVTAGSLGVDLSLLYEPQAPVILNGPCMLVGNAGGDHALVGVFAQVQWLEFPTTVFNT
jgi:hypothetical protein